MDGVSYKNAKWALEMDHDWLILDPWPVDKINVSKMWIGWILLGPENNGLWFVEHSFSASGENRIHTHARTHTHVTKQWPAVWTGEFFGPLHDWSTVAVGPLDNPKRMWPLDHRCARCWARPTLKDVANWNYKTGLFFTIRRKDILSH